MHTRRQLIIRSLASFTSYALLAESARAGLAASGENVRRWIGRQDEIARALAAGEMAQADWHDEIGRLAGEVDLAELASEIDRAQIIDGGAPYGRDPVKRIVRFHGEDGAPQALGYGAALFAFAPDCVITPHAHRYMASAHLVLEGAVRVRTFDRIGQDRDAIIIRPTGDHIAGVGDATAMTSAKDNVHWFAAHGGPAKTFDIIIDGLEGGDRRYLIEPVDPLGGEKRADGAIKAPILSFEESMRRYSATL